jgi:hypothetical protein
LIYGFLITLWYLQIFFTSHKIDINSIIHTAIYEASWCVHSCNFIINSHLKCAFCAGMVLVRQWNNWKSIKITETIYIPFQNLNFWLIQIVSCNFQKKNSEENSWNQLNNWKKSFLFVVPIWPIDIFWDDMSDTFTSKDSRHGCPSG